ncbi:MAG TPA: SIMPL domain-containing protein [Streptosporangiaceae bacterium]
MNGGGSPLLSVRAEARQLVAPDYAVVDGLIELTAGSKAEAVRSVTGSLDHLTADLAALGAVPFDEGAGRRPLTWSAPPSARPGTTPPRWAPRCGTLSTSPTLACSGGDTAPYQPGHVVTAKAFGGVGDQPGTPALTPVPQELIATIEARFRTTDVSLSNA